MKLSPSVVGALIGALLGAVILYPKLLIIVVPAALGYFTGRILESEELREKARELFSVFFR